MNALIPALAALAGALIGAMVSVFITIYQINSSQHEAVDSFLRTQRQSAYAAFLADANELRASATAFVYKKVKDSSDINSLITKVSNEYYSIEILGPFAVVFESSKVYLDAACIGEDMNIGYYGFKCGHTAVYDLNAISQDIAKASFDMTQIIENN
jgi:hypothetical protein